MDILIFFLIMFGISLLLMHLFWMMYASEEEPGEYYRHPFFEPEEDISTLHFVITWLISLIISPVLIPWLVLMITGRYDALAVYIEKDEGDKLKKWWKFWRWGIKKIPKTLSPLYSPKTSKYGGKEE